MGLVFETRLSDSPYVELITHGWTDGPGSAIRPAEAHWHWVIVKQTVKHSDQIQSIVTGPLSASGIASWPDSAEILWIQFRLGTFMPHLPAKILLDKETRLPEAGDRSFWLKGDSLQFPDFENVEAFVKRLVRNEVLAHDSIVEAALQGHPLDLSPRTVRHRFLRSTGLTQGQIHQIARAKQAAALLAQGVSILDTVYDAGYFDQPHLTRSLRRWVGYTPAQLLQQNTP